MPDCQVSRVTGTAGLQHDLLRKAALIHVLRPVSRHRLEHGVALGSIGRLVDRPHDRVGLFALGRFHHRPLHGVGFFPYGGFHHRPGDRVAILAHRRLPNRLVGRDLPLLADVLIFDAVCGELPLFVDRLVDDAIGLAARTRQTGRRRTTVLGRGRRRSCQQHRQGPTAKRTAAFMVYLLPFPCRRQPAGRNHQRTKNPPSESAR